jgi:hypothetical protein
MEAMVSVAALARALGRFARIATAWPVLAACGDEPRCGRLPQCDIRTSGCQRDVLAIAACARGDAPTRVAIRVMDFDAYVQSEVEAVAGTDPAERAQRERFYAGLARLGLVREGLTLEGAVEQSVDWVGAFYASDEREIVVLDRGSALDGISTTGLLLHELVHALQDHAHGLDALYAAQPPGRDGAMGLSAVIEGEAVMHTDRALADAFGYPPHDVDWDGLYRRYGARGSRILAHSESPLFDVSAWFVYAFGARYVTGAFEHGGSPALTALYDGPPVSARQVALGFDAAEPDDGAWHESGLEAEALPPAPAEFELLGELHLGAYFAHLFAARPDATRARAPLSASASDRLRADVLTVQGGPDGALLVSWRLRFSAGVHARRFLDAITTPLADATWVEGRDAIVVAASAPDLIEPLRHAGAWRALPDGDTRPDTSDGAAARVLCMQPLP